jgi:hypothetical protein
MNPEELFECERCQFRASILGPGQGIGHPLRANLSAKVAKVSQAQRI